MKDKLLKDLDTICETVYNEEGTIFNIFDLAYPIKRQIAFCYRIGITRVEVEKILSKYTNGHTTA